MIVLNELVIKNFLSIGNTPVTFPFNNGINVIVGKNGQGKSTILDALSFVLFGQAYSKKTKNQLINRKNKNKTLVSLKFSKNGNEYEIIRGIKPDIQKIIENGDDKDITDIKSFNEDICTILNIDMKVFSHTTFMSNNFYEPFLTLNPSKKRDFLKRIFSFETFENMEINIKKDLKKYENDIVTEKHKLDMTKEKIELKSKHLEEQKTFITKEIDALNDDIKQYKDSIKLCNDKIVKIDTSFHERIDEAKTELSKLEFDIEKYIENVKNKKKKIELSKRIEEIKFDQSVIDSYTDINNKYILNMSECNRLINENEKRKLYLENNNICDQCGNEMSFEYKRSNIESCEKIIETNKQQLKDINTKFKKYESKYNDSKEKMDEYNKLMVEYNSINCSMYNSISDDIDNVINALKVEIMELESEKNKNDEIERENIKLLSDIRNMELNIKNGESKIKTYENQLSELDGSEISKLEGVLNNIKDHINKLNKKIDIMRMLLKSVGDNGIKKYIIQNYIPMLNQTLNDFSSIIDSKFVVNFTPDGMNIELKERGIEIDYGQLSSGEQQRISLIVLFTFIKFMRMKSGNMFPLVFFDEILNSSLDDNGLQGLISIIENMKEQIPYLYIITHDLKSIEFADNIVQVKKEGGFSSYEFI